MTTLTEEEQAFALGLEVEKIPARLRCGICNKCAFDAMKLLCCDTTICKSCQQELSGTCSICEHETSPEMCAEDKRARITLKHHIKGELSKRNKAAAAAAAALKNTDAEKSAPVVEKEENAPSAKPADATQGGHLDEVPLYHPEIQQSVTKSLNGETDPSNANSSANIMADEDVADGDAADDKSDVEIITERPEGQEQYGFGNGSHNEDESFENGQQGQIAQDYTGQQQTMNFDAGQQGFPAMNNNAMGFGDMNGFNPMMAMQGMGMPGFPMGMPNMMGMPGMGMDASMMFNGGFGGMNAMANMMNGNMMNGGFGNMTDMGGMDQFGQYNQYGNRFNNRPPRQQFFPSNRGFARGNAYGNRDWRGRGGYGVGRGRGNWNNFQDHSNHQQYGHSMQNGQYNQGAAYEDQAGFDQEFHQSDEQVAKQDESMTNTAEFTSKNDAIAASTTPCDDVADAGGAHDDNADAQNAERNPPNDTKTQSESQVPQHNAQSPPTGPAGFSGIGGPRHVANAPSPAPPLNAPTGPKAMRDGLPNSGRYSRPQASSVSRVDNEQATPTGPASASSKIRRDHDDYEREDDERADRSRRESRSRTRSRSRSRSRHGHKHKRRRSRSARKDEHDSDEKYIRSRDDGKDRHRRKDRKRTREYDEDEGGHSKKRTRSASADSSHRRHRHRDEKDRSRHDRSRDRRHASYRDRSAERKEDEHPGRKSKSRHKSSRRDYDEDDEEYAAEVFNQKHVSRHARAILEEPQDDIGFKIKGTKSGNSGNNPPTAPASHRDPYAEERERFKVERLQKDAERRQGTQGSGKRGREQGGGADDIVRKKRSKPKAKYEDEIGDHEKERERGRWR